MKRQSGGILLALLLGLILAMLGGGVGFYFGKPMIEQAKASESWPTAEGRVIESALGRKREDGKTTYSANVTYEYEVDGQTYECDTVWFGQYSSSRRSEMSAIVRQYPEGSEVKVYYSPETPDIAVLQTGATASTYMVFGIGMLFLGIGTLIVIVPLVKLLFFASVVAVAPEDAFAGGRSFASNNTFGPASDEEDRNVSRQQPRQARSSRETPAEWTGDELDDDDGFHGIPGN